MTLKLLTLSTNVSVSFFICYSSFFYSYFFTSLFLFFFNLLVLCLPPSIPLLSLSLSSFLSYIKSYTFFVNFSKNLYYTLSIWIHICFCLLFSFILFSTSIFSLLLILYPFQLFHHLQLLDLSLPLLVFFFYPCSGSNFYSCFCLSIFLLLLLL